MCFKTKLAPNIAVRINNGNIIVDINGQFNVDSVILNAAVNHDYAQQTDSCAVGAP